MSDPIAAPTPQPSPTTDARAAKPKPRDWVPIRSMSPRHRPRILEHLLALDAHDRYLRFGSPATDAQIAHYVDLIDFDRDEVFGIFNRALVLIAHAHLAFPFDLRRRVAVLRSAEFGVSVLGSARGRGFGARLFERAVLHARNRNVERMVIHALSENAAMLRIARNAGATVVREGADSQAELALPPDDFGSHVEEAVEQAIGEIDFRLKAQAVALGEWVSSLTSASSTSSTLESTEPRPEGVTTKTPGTEHAPSTTHTTTPARD
jgi:RimJ/RimL family protein N-acetyltransferase